MHVVVALSGGVDSAVAAALLREQGHEVTGAFLRNGIAAGPAAERSRQGCCGVDDAADAAAVARRLDIPFYALDHAAEFDALIREFADEYARGRTPNPCILCNRDIKLGRLLDFTRGIGADAVATGHYARLERHGERWAIREARDAAKDQSYVLFPLTQAQLARSLFPLGDLTKLETRQRARELGLPVAEKPESMEICFVPGGDYRAVLRERRPDALEPGPLVDGASGAVVGSHGGVGSVTLGQRRGLGVAMGAPRYVTDVDPDSRVVTVGPREEALRTAVVVGGWNAVAKEPPALGQTVRGAARVRRMHVAAECVAERVDAAGSRVRVTFDAPVLAPAPGQALVLYDEERFVLGGGWIEGPARAVSD